MKHTPPQQLLAALALLGLPFSALADEVTKPATPAPIAPAAAATPTPAPTPAPAVTAPTVAPAPVPLAVVIPPPAPKVPMATAHVVKDRETLSGIAQQYGVKTETLRLWNRIVNPNRLALGQSIEIPPETVAPRSVKASVPVTPTAPAPAAAPVPQQPRATASAS